MTEEIDKVDTDLPPPRERVKRRRKSGEISDDRDFVNALGRGLIVLEAFSSSADVWLNGMEVAEKVGLPKPTTSRLLQALRSQGYLHYSPNRRQYRLGASVLSLGFAAREPFSLGDLVKPYLRELADEYNVHASLAARDRLDVIEVEVCHSVNTLMTLRLEVGSRIPLAGTATGHALIAPLPDAEKEYLFGRLRERHHKHWAELEASIDSGCQEVAELGYTTKAASWNTDINGVAAPLVVPGGASGGGSGYALACGAPARHLPLAKQRKIGQRLVEIAHLLEEKLQQGTS